MRGKHIVILSLVLGLVIFMSACGEKSREQISDQLTKQVNQLENYHAKAEMTMNTGQEEQVYLIDVLFQKDHYHRIHLQNKADEFESQTILKNDDGVFVITPGQPKAFKFQSDWPENSSQAYLYHSLVNDLLKDGESSFEVTDDYYVYRVQANYQNSYQLPEQEIFFNKKTLTPALVNIMDQEGDLIVQVSFLQFELDLEIDMKEFIVEEHVTESMASAEAGTEDIEFDVLYPLNTLGAELVEQKEVYLDGGKRIIMVFSGEKNFTLIQEKKLAEKMFTDLYEVKGELVHLGLSVAGISDSSIEWSMGGVDYYLASEELTDEELIEIAMSVQGRGIK